MLSVGYGAFVDQGVAPPLDVLADYHQRGRCGFTATVIPSATDAALDAIVVVA